MPVVEKGCVAVATVQRKVVVVQAARTHTERDHYLDVFTYIPFGNRTFFLSSVPQARISPLDILTIFPGSDFPHLLTGRRERTLTEEGKAVLELPPQAFKEFLELSARVQRRYEKLFSVWTDAGGPRGKKARMLA